MDRMKRLCEAIRQLAKEEFNGHIRINFSQGSIGRIEKTEEIEDVAICLNGTKSNDKKKGGLS
jgi:hypothetical protein